MHLVRLFDKNFVTLQKVEAIEEAFSCVLVHNLGHETDKIKTWQTELNAAMSRLPVDQQEAAIKQFLAMASVMTNHKRLQMLLSLLESMVTGSVLPARCDLCFIYLFIY